MSKAALTKLDKYCKDHGLKATPPRRYVLEIIHEATKPLTAYDALEKLGEKLSKPNPPTAYRALDFLSAHGFIHRIESLNAYIACDVNHRHQGSQFMICDECGDVHEVHLCHVPDGLQKQAKTQGFTLSHWNVELHGRCKSCQ